MKKMNWSAGLLLVLLVCGRSDRNFPLAGFGNSAKGANCCCWPLILAGTAPRDDGLGMMIHFAAPLFLDFTSHAVVISSFSLFFARYIHSLAFPKHLPFFFLFPHSGSLDTNIFSFDNFQQLNLFLLFSFFNFLLFTTWLRAVIIFNAYTYIYRNNRTEEEKDHSHARIS